MKLKRDVPISQEFPSLKSATNYFQGVLNILNTVFLESKQKEQGQGQGQGY